MFRELDYTVHSVCFWFTKKKLTIRVIHFKNQAALFMRFMIHWKHLTLESFVSGNNLQCYYCKVLINNQMIWVIHYENKATLFMLYAFDWQKTKNQIIRVICFKNQATMFMVYVFDSLKRIEWLKSFVLRIELHCSCCMFLIHLCFHTKTDNRHGVKEVWDYTYWGQSTKELKYIFRIIYTVGQKSI